METRHAHRCSLISIVQNRRDTTHSGFAREADVSAVQCSQEHKRLKQSNSNVQQFKCREQSSEEERHEIGQRFYGQSVPCWPKGLYCALLASAAERIINRFVWTTSSVAVKYAHRRFATVE